MSRLILGDCVQVMADIPEKAVDFILTDPPYLVGFRDRQGRTIAGDKTDEWLQPACHEMYRVLKNDALMVSFYGWNRVDRFMAAWKHAGFSVVGHLVFTKTYTSKSTYVGYRTARRHTGSYITITQNIVDFDSETASSAARAAWGNSSYKIILKQSAKEFAKYNQLYTSNPGSPIQFCPMPPPVFQRIGLAIGYWEPMAMTDVARSPGCTVNLGGFTINLGKMGMGTAKKDDKQVNGAFYHVHWYKYPLTYWLNIITSLGCLQGGDLDIRGNLHLKQALEKVVEKGECRDEAQQLLNKGEAR